MRKALLRTPLGEERLGTARTGQRRTSMILHAADDGIDDPTLCQAVCPARRRGELSRAAGWPPAIRWTVHTAHKGGVTRTAVLRSDWQASCTLSASYVSCISRPCALRVHELADAPPCGGTTVELEALFGAARSPIIRLITPGPQVMMFRLFVAGCCWCACCLRQAQTVANCDPWRSSCALVGDFLLQGGAH